MANLKHTIQIHMGMPSALQVLVFEGKVLQDQHQFEDYGVGQDSKKFLSLGMRGASSAHRDIDAGSKNTNGPTTFKDTLKGKNDALAE